MPSIGLSLFTKTASMSMLVGSWTHLYPKRDSNSSCSLSFILRLMGPKVAVPSISAGGAVEEPLPSISTCTLGYSLANPSAHSVIRLFIVSEPTLLIEPDTPCTGS